ncbi:MAG: hypothetical protein ACFFDH_03090 [Promethearchaeota archaeon]
MTKKYRKTKVAFRKCGGLILWDASPSVNWQIHINSTRLLNVNKDLLVSEYAYIWNFINEFNPYEWPL